MSTTLQNGCNPIKQREHFSILQIFSILVILITLIGLSTMYSTGTSLLAIRQACIDMNLPDDCNDDKAIDMASQVTMYAFITAGLISLGSIGVLSASGNYLGRKKLLMLGTFGGFSSSALWPVIYYIPSLAKFWKAGVVISTALMFLFGSGVILNLSLFGIITDMTTYNAKYRLPVYIAIDILMSLVAVGGNQLVAIFLNHSAKLFANVLCFGLLGLIAFTAIFFSETIDPKLQQEPIKWKKANIFPQMAFLLPTKSSLKPLNDDHQMIFIKLAHVYNSLIEKMNDNSSEVVANLIDIPTVLAESSLNDDGDIDTSTKSLNSDQDSMKATLLNNNNNAGHQQYESNDNVFVIDGNINTLTTSATTSINGDMVSTNLALAAVNEEIQHQQQEEKEQQDLLPRPPKLSDFISPPSLVFHTNAMLCLAVANFLFSCVSLAQAMIPLYYAKKLFNMSSDKYSNLLSIIAIIRIVSSFVIVPLFSALAKTPAQQRMALCLTLLFCALINVGMALAKTYWQFCVAVIVYSLLAGIPSGITRSLISNQVSNKLQGDLLSALAGCDVMVILFGGLSFNAVWLATSTAMPTASFYVMAGLTVLAAFISIVAMKDNAETFSQRVQMATLYTKIFDAQAVEVQEDIVASDITLQTSN